MSNVPESQVAQDTPIAAIASQIEAAEVPDASQAQPSADSKTTTESPEVKPVEYKLALPKDSVLEPQSVEKIASFAKERGLSNEQAQAVLDQMNADRSAFVESQKSELVAKSKQWVEQIRTDKELGGDNFNKTVESAKRVVDKYASDSFKAILDSTGLGNHPELVKLFYKISKEMEPDSLVLSSAAPAKELTREEKFYGAKSE